MQFDCSSNDLFDTLLNLRWEASQSHMLGENALVDGLESLHAWETDSKDTEVALEARVDGEAASSRVHAGDVLDIVDLLQRELMAIIPTQ